MFTFIFVGKREDFTVKLFSNMDFHIQYINNLRDLNDYLKYDDADAVIIKANETNEKLHAFLHSHHIEEIPPILAIIEKKSSPKEIFRLARSGIESLIENPFTEEALFIKLKRLSEIRNMCNKKGSTLRTSTSEKFNNLLVKAENYANESSHIVIEGKTGSGKGYLAKLIHHQSNRRDEPFLSINCASIPEPIFEAELFGTEKGAFTDSKTRPGIFEKAGKGTLFLDEIGELSVNIQAKLLKVIEERTYYRLGSLELKKFEARLILATHRNLKKMTKKNFFRKDLYYRINVLNLIIPSLKKRIDDIPQLTYHFLKDLNSSKKLTRQALKKLLRHKWPGNVRELQSVIQRAVILSKDSEYIETRHIIF